MKRSEESTNLQTAATSAQQTQQTPVTSASVENAHATGDGTVKKTDELDTQDESENTSTESTPY